MSVIVIGGGPHPKNAKVVSDDKGHRIEDETGTVLASGFSTPEDAARYLASLVAAQVPSAKPEE